MPTPTPTRRSCMSCRRRSPASRSMRAARVAAAQHVDPSRRDLRRDDAAPVRQRRPGGDPGGREPAADLDGRAPVRRQQRVGRILRGAHRRSPPLQPGARRGRDPDGHGGADRHGHDAAGPLERSTHRDAACRDDADHIEPDDERERHVPVRPDAQASPMRRCPTRLRRLAAPITARQYPGSPTAAATPATCGVRTRRAMPTRTISRLRSRWPIRRRRTRSCRRCR